MQKWPLVFSYAYKNISVLFLQSRNNLALLTEISCMNPHKKLFKKKFYLINILQFWKFSSSHIV